LTLPRVDLVRSAVSQDTLRTVERGSTNALLVSYWGVALALEDPLGDLFDISYGDLAGVLVGRDRAGGRQLWLDRSAPDWLARLRQDISSTFVDLRMVPASDLRVRDRLSSGAVVVAVDCDEPIRRQAPTSHPHHTRGPRPEATARTSSGGLW